MVACHEHCEVPYCSRTCMEQVIAEGLSMCKEFAEASSHPQQQAGKG